MAELFPEELLMATDAVLDTVEDQFAGLDDPGDEKVLAVVERVVRALQIRFPRGPQGVGRQW
ncbi:hypothetical protein [Streptomyces nogalater]|uniref:Uncharacterized protein n=1 Tax=Streptomyces nogalater TaxID=38314 RepID=A0ABW0WEI6_STRNO